MTKLKVCGLTNVANALAVAHEGVDAIGLNFYITSPRCVSIEVAREICQTLPPFITRVGLFVNHTEAEVERVLDTVELDILQFHGDESVKFCESFDYPYIKALGVDVTTQIAQYAHTYSSAKALLLDAKSEYFGGSGTTFDWSLIQDLPLPIILAGGITPENAAKAIQQVQPYALDTASGVESGIKGIKNIDKVRALVETIRS